MRMQVYEKQALGIVISDLFLGCNARLKTL